MPDTSAYAGFEAEGYTEEYEREEPIMPNGGWPLEDVIQPFVGEEEPPWILPGPGELPIPPAGGGALPPGGVEPTAGDTCESLNMEAMDPLSPEVVAAKWAGIYTHGVYPYCVAKGSGAPPQAYPLPAPPETLPAPAAPAAPAPALPAPEAAAHEFCVNRGYVEDEAATKRLYLGIAAGVAGGALVGGLLGYFIGQRPRR